MLGTFSIYVHLYIHVWIYVGAVLHNVGIVIGKLYTQQYCPYCTEFFIYYCTVHTYIGLCGTTYFCIMLISYLVVVPASLEHCSGFIWFTACNPIILYQKLLGCEA